VVARTFHEAELPVAFVYRMECMRDKHNLDLKQTGVTMKPSIARTAMAAAVSLALLSPAHAALTRMGPINNSPTVGGFPAWFQDSTGIALEFCDPQSQAELNGGRCVLLPGDAIIPEQFPTNFFDEHFYWRADSAVDDGVTRSRLVLGLE